MVDKNNVQKVLEFFFDNPTRSVYLRELSREMKLSMPAIIASVQKLSSEELVSINKEKALTIIKSNVSSTKFIRLKRVSNLEKLYASGLVDVLQKTFKNPQVIICFGSYSRGEDTEQSDIDVGIIGSKETDVDLSNFETFLNRPISLHIIDVLRASKEFKSNLCNGIVLEGAL